MKTEAKTSKLSKQFTFGSLITFAAPNVIMMICLSMYIIVDGMFISRFLGTTALSAVNMVYPFLCLEMAIAIMIATGGSAIISKKLGEAKQSEARRDFSFLILVEIAIGLIFAIFCTIFTKQIVLLLGASNLQLQLCIDYSKILFMFAPAFFLQTAFQTFFVTAGKPTFGLILTLLSGVTNIVLDYVFMSPLSMGVQGAAIATGIGYCIPAITGLLFFLCTKKNVLRFVKPKFSGQTLWNSCTNGSSEMVTNLANALTTFLFNYTFMKFYGEDGVAAITVILYFQYIFTALYFGYSNGIAPIISFKYGCKDNHQLQNIFKYSIIFLTISTIVSNVFVHLTVNQAITIFTEKGSNVYNIIISGFPYYAISFSLMEICIFSSALFTAFSDGKISAIISFARTFIFTVGAILLLPLIFDTIGVWIAVPVAETLGAIIAIIFLYVKKNKYGYVKLKKENSI